MILIRSTLFCSGIALVAYHETLDDEALASKAIYPDVQNFPKRTIYH